MIFINTFCGYLDFKNEITNDECLKKMFSALSNNNIHQDIYLSNHVALSQSLDIYHINNYYILFNGELYNKEDIKSELSKSNYNVNLKQDNEIVLLTYLEYGEKCVKYFNGVFSFVIYNAYDKSLFMATDRLGIKPLYYTMNNSFIFATKISAILKHFDVKAILDKTGLMELIGLGPAHTPGSTYFKDIFILKPGFIATFKNNKFTTTQYWDLKAQESFDDENEAIKQIHDLVLDATTKQINLGCSSSMLSGGLDSSILCKIANDISPTLSTYSIDYVDSEKNFIANDYQMTKDSEYIKIMKDYINSNHKTAIIDNTLLFNLLDEALLARDMPGMADIDSSMLALCKFIRNDGCTSCLSGECSDEIFGGYPWFYKEKNMSNDGFLWAMSNTLRSNIVKKGILQDTELIKYIIDSKNNTLKDVVHLDIEDKFERQFRDTCYLTIKWFMNTLIERTQSLSSICSLNVRMPFADYRIFEYVYNLSAKMKLNISKTSLPIEKFLLRKAFENELPYDIVYRKKSPFPKTYDPIYLNLVESKMQEILNDKNSKLSQIIDFDFVESILNVHGENLTQNWFGQLMTYPQTLAYLIQIDKWLTYYNIEIKL
ncbi:MAG: asparagine synthase (glutamine-hydrolyzing) [Clostridia bacterium]